LLSPPCAGISGQVMSMNDAEFQKLLNAESPLIIKPAIRDSALHLMLFIILIAGMLIVYVRMPIFDFNLATKVLLGFGAICIFYRVVLYTALLLYPDLWALKFNDNYFSFKNSPYGKNQFSWSDISPFTLGYDYRGINTNVTFYDAASKKITLPDYLPFSDKQLTQLMNHWRERAISNNNDVTLA